MSPEAELRMSVYQEGQRAFNSRELCPYTDWRKGTWTKGFEAAKAYHNKYMTAEVIEQRMRDKQRLAELTELLTEEQKAEIAELLTGLTHEEIVRRLKNAG